mmetsp:Transcript_14538/g.54909  ORF Transcript_14538/g.54909 Transcript_14538/m.54909 type:complete len:204 (-) Transcript_14538:768-1379(-)
MDRGATALSNGIHVCAVLEQELDNFPVAPTCSEVQRGLPALLDCVHWSSVRKEKQGHRVMTLEGCKMERCCFPLVSLVDLSTLLQQERDDYRVAIPRRQMKGRTGVSLFNVHPSCSVDQQRDHGVVSVVAGQVQRRTSVEGALVHLGSTREEEGHHGSLAFPGRDMKRRPPLPLLDVDVGASACKKPNDADLIILGRQVQGHP